MAVKDTLAVGDLFLAEPIQISKNRVKARTTPWPAVDSIIITPDQDRASPEPFIAEVSRISEGTVRAERVEPDGPRMVLPGDEIAITVDTIASNGIPVADVSAARNIESVHPLEHYNPGASLEVRIIHVAGPMAYAELLTVQEPGVTVGDEVDVQLERGASTAEFVERNLDTPTCQLDRVPTAGGPGVARITEFTAGGIEVQLRETKYHLEVGDRYEMTLERGESVADPHWDGALGVHSVALDEPAGASTTAVVELTSVDEPVAGRIIEYQNVPAIGSTHRVGLGRGRDSVVLDGIPVELETPSEVSGDGTIEITGGPVPLEGHIVAYHDLPDAGSVLTVTLERGQESIIHQGCPIELTTPSEIDGDVSVETVGDGPPFDGRIIEYHGLPDSGELIDCTVARGDSKVTHEGIPIRFSPQSRVGKLDIRLEVLDTTPAVDAELIDYPTLDEGMTTRATVDSEDLSVAYATEGDYRIDLIEAAEKAAEVRVRLTTVTPETIEGTIDGYLSIGSTGQNVDSGSDTRSPFEPGGSKNDEITGKKL